jgi:hypothetical protein
MKNVNGLITAFIAGAAIPRYAIVRVTGDGSTVTVATAGTQTLIGVSAEPGEVAIGQSVDVVHSGIVLVKALTAINVGAMVTAGAGGRAAVAGSTDETIGRAISASNANGDLISIKIIQG